MDFFERTCLPAALRCLKLQDPQLQRSFVTRIEQQGQFSFSAGRRPGRPRCAEPCSAGTERRRREAATTTEQRAQKCPTRCSTRASRGSRWRTPSSSVTTTESGCALADRTGPPAAAKRRHIGRLLLAFPVPASLTDQRALALLCRHAGTRMAEEAEERRRQVTVERVRPLGCRQRYLLGAESRRSQRARVCVCAGADAAGL